jgi:glycosyltransferase involved in cell wall biosynthesis
VRILAASSWFPYPPDNGSRLRIYNLLKRWTRHHEIALVAFASSEVAASQLEALKPICAWVRTVPRRFFQPHSLRAYLGFLSLYPRSWIDTYSPEMQRLLNTVVQSQAFDLLLALQFGTAPYVAGIDSTKPKVLEELELGVLYDQHRRNPNWVKRLRYGLTWAKKGHFVRRTLDRFDGCTTVSEVERDIALEIAPGFSPVEVIPNGVDVAHYQGGFGPLEPGTLIFCGSFTWSANLDAMRFFLEQVYPLVKQRVPGVRLRITGRSGEAQRDSLPADESVEFTGYLDDVRPAIARSWVSIAPMRIGGGTRVKILEAMALGTPVVATYKGAEGLNVTSGTDILLADTPALLADHIVALLCDHELRARLAVAGKQLVTDQYDWDIIATKAEAFLTQVVSNQG